MGNGHTICADWEASALPDIWCERLAGAAVTHCAEGWLQTAVHVFTITDITTPSIPEA